MTGQAAQIRRLARGIAKPSRFDIYPLIPVIKDGVSLGYLTLRLARDGQAHPISAREVAEVVKSIVDELNSAGYFEGEMRPAIERGVEHSLGMSVHSPQWVCVGHIIHELEAMD